MLGIWVVVDVRYSRCEDESSNPEGSGGRGRARAVAVLGAAETTQTVGVPKIF